MSFSKQLKEKIHLVNYLNHVGLKAAKETDRYNYYYSPFNPNEDKPTFKVDIKKNVWHDYTQTSQSVIDFVMQTKNMKLREAVNHLKELYNVIDIKENIFLERNLSNTIAEINLNNIQPLQTKALIQYVESRKISLPTARKYLKEVYYKAKPEQAKPYFALAFRNDKNGYELRNKYFKGAAAPKTITTISGSKSDVLTIFEGFMDFLSALEFYSLKTPNNTTIVLNSLSNLKQVLPLLSQYRKIHLFLDNDTEKNGFAGQKAARTIAEQHKSVTNQSALLYPEYKDFNEFICNKKRD